MPSHSKQVLNFITDIKKELSNNYDNVKEYFHKNLVEFKSGENQILLCSLKITTVKDCSITGEMPKIIKELSK